MTATESGPTAGTLLDQWSRFERLPAGRLLFSIALGWQIPYSSTIGARVAELRKGQACLYLPDRRRVRNHLDSIHAVALVNLGELTTGLAVFSTTGATMRGILVDIRAEYLKKARGRLEARAEFELPDDLEDNTACEVVATIRDLEGDTVCTVTATWLIGYRQT
jgi:acyl-coenzyme A thioesterase PaaI-like protein